MQKALPCQYQTIEPGLLHNNYKNYEANKVRFGFGEKTDFTNIGEARAVPGPIYNHHEKNSLSYLLNKRKTVAQNHFGNKFDKYDMICYEGMEQHFYLRGTKGPGAYLPQDLVPTSKNKNNGKFSIPKTDRGLLSNSTRKQSPGPTDYELSEKQMQIKLRAMERFKMPRAERDINIMKFGSQHKTLIAKGLQ